MLGVEASGKTLTSRNESADMLEKKSDDDLDENAATQVELGRTPRTLLELSLNPP